MELDVGGVTEKRPRGLENQRVHHELPGRGRAGDQGAGAPGQVPTEVVGTRRRGVEEGAELGLDGVEQLHRRHVVDDHRTVRAQRGHDGVGGGVGRKVGDRHGPILPNARPVGQPTAHKAPGHSSLDS